MNNIVKILTILIFSSSILYAQAERKSSTYTVVLNLDDRLTIEGQLKRDKEVITVLFQKFKENVKKQLYILSKDQFRIIVTPQSGQQPYYQIESELSINLRDMQPGKKRTELDKFESNLNKRLDHLYDKAYKGSDKDLYAGSDLWRFFNDQLSDIIQQNESDIQNVYLLCDGYIDFEDDQWQEKRDNKYSNTEFITKLRQADHPQRKLQEEKYGLLPIDCDLSDTNIYLMEINPKSNHLLELQILETIWENWFEEMGAHSFQFVNKYSIKEVKSIVAR